MRLRPTALIAEDEPLLAQALVDELASIWPELEIIAVVSDGLSAQKMLCELKPDCAFLDIQMPGASGIDAAAAMLEDWPNQRPPLLVFVTAFNEYATEAFEQAAVDYVMKPITANRLAKTVARLQSALSRPDTHAALDHLAIQLRQLVAQPREQHYLSSVTASIGDKIRLIRCDDILFFEASDKYIRVVTEQAEALIREPLKSLVSKLDPEQFIQIHRSTLVNREAIDHLVRDPDGSGKLALHIKGCKEVLNVSRLYSGLFKPM
jgi:DNA-binding LytR/AlgR family response regulator